MNLLPQHKRHRLHQSGNCIQCLRNLILYVIFECFSPESNNQPVNTNAIEKHESSIVEAEYKKRCEHTCVVQLSVAVCAIITRDTGNFCDGNSELGGSAIHSFREITFTEYTASGVGSTRRQMNLYQFVAKAKSETLKINANGTYLSNFDLKSSLNTSQSPPPTLIESTKRRSKLH